jgi:hypothetical protein
MNLNIYDYMKIDTAVGMVTSSIPVTGFYFSLAESQHTAFLFTMGTVIQDTRNCIGQLYQAKDALGTDAKVITGATCTIMANVKAKLTTASLNSVVAGNTLVVNGLTYTAHATTTSYANREFSIAGGDDTGADELADCINHPEYGVPGIKAVKTSVHLITLTPIIPGTGYMTTVGGYTITVRSQATDGIIEVNADMLDYVNGFNHVAIKLTPSTTLYMYAMILRGYNRYTPKQYFSSEQIGV